ncbi:hypothetical protein Poli38472_010114 [Pythium oligandrum]|uniref:Ankyrin repeat protein n=1 Tax=Pythium oligandrum TaxID=41045 RepID=A0A8K1C8R7_PYTOL|nr:hypothetical protein Poli38472_010114 [Pythium oligandrum]|eukprot:TMW58555.1 hypothetical protein Poli38472_010114 [Pythium oligandrum]
MDFSKCQRIQRRLPVKFDAEVMYTAAERGVLAEVAWLHRYTDYQAKEAIERTAAACHVDVLEWLLDHQDTANKRSDRQTSQRLRIKLRQFESSLRATCWSDLVEKTAYCVMDGVGFLPPNPSNVELYQLMDWAAKEGNLAMLQRLHEDPIGTKTCSFLAMYHAAEIGDLTMLRWLHKHRTERNDYMIAVLAAAVEHGHLAAMDWIRDAYFTGPMVQPVFATALRAGQVDVVRQLATHFEDQVRALLRYRYSMPNNPEMVEYICEKLGYELAASDLDLVWMLGKKKLGKDSMDELVEIAFKYGHLKCRKQLLDAILRTTFE